MTYGKQFPFFAFLTAALLSVGFVCADARADDPGDDGFPPAETPSEEPAADTPAEDAAAEKTDAPSPATRETPPTGWSPPATAPRRAPPVARNDPSLPPPRVVRRRHGGMPAAGASTPRRATPPMRAPATAGTRETAPTGGTLPPIAVTPRTARAPVAPARTAQPAAPVAPRTAVTTTPRATDRGLEGNRVYNITKVHNVALDNRSAAPGELALQLDVDYEVRGQAGRDVYVAVWFARSDDDTLIRSALPTYRDRAGHATLQTRAARVSQPAARFKATVRIPYRAFPMAAGESSYEVVARVQVLRSEPGGQVTLLCRGSTTFRVYGFDEDAGAEPDTMPAPARVEGAGGTSIAGEDGRISDPVGR